jgi:probable HAF family extracellular repeat protein
MSDLGTLDGPTANSFANRENSGGQIIGSSDTSVAGERHAFIWSGASPVDLGTLGGNTVTANGINAGRTVVGSSQLAGTTTTHAFEYSNGAMTDLGTLGGDTSTALGINDTGEIVGTSRTAGGQNRAFTFLNGALIQIPTLGGNVSQANAANAAGEVVGFSQTATGDQHAFVYQNGTVTDLNNLLGGQSSTAVAVNSSGQVAGTYQPSGADTSREHAFLYSNGVITDLGTAGQTSSQATAINSKGDIAGFLKTPFGASQAFLYSNGALTNIDTFDASSTVVAMNDNDQVLINAGTNVARLYSNGTLIDVTPPNALTVQPVAMNSGGAIVENATGNFGGNAYYHAFLYQGGTFTDIGALINASSTFATDIDAAGDVLGHFTASNGLEQPFLFTDGTVYDLNNYVSGLPPGWSIESATFDGSASALLATAYEGQRTETFLLQVPEPASAGLILIAAVTLLTRRPVHQPV